MYSYSPKLNKRREKILCAILAALTVLFLLPTYHPQTPYRVLFHMGALAALTAALLVAIRYLARDYTYSVEAADNGSEIPDLVITERYARRISVVCRISVSEIEAITPLTKQSREQLRETVGTLPTYTYTAQMGMDHQYLLTVQTGESHFFLRILADEGLKNAMFQWREQ